MFAFLKRFRQSEAGAITVDWVVLTAAVAGLCIAFIAELKSEANGLSSLTQDYLEAQEPALAAGGNIQDGTAAMSRRKSRRARFHTALAVARAAGRGPEGTSATPCQKTRRCHQSFLKQKKIGTTCPADTFRRS